MSTYGYLAHHGIKGQKWGVRRYQNPDGSLTPAGRERYYKDRIKELKNEYNNKTPKEKRTELGLKNYIRENYGDSYRKDKEFAEKRIKEKRVRAISGVALGATMTAAGAIATYTALDALGITSMIKAGQREGVTEWSDRVENMLDDKDTMEKLEKDSKVYRMVFGGTTGVDQSKLFNESLYVTDKQRDRELYKQVLNPLHQGGGIKQEVTYKLKNDIYTAQGKVLFDYALEAIGSNKSADDIGDACRKYENLSSWEKMRQSPPKGYDDYTRAYAAIFNLVSKDSSGKLKSEDSKKLRNKLMEEGFGAVKDYQDSGVLGKTPRVLLDSKNDISVDTIKEVDRISEILSRLKLGALTLGT